MSDFDLHTKLDSPDAEEVVEKVRERYAAFATAGTSCCGPAPTSCCGSTQTVAQSLGYDSIDLDLQPEIVSFRGYDDYIVGYNTQRYVDGSINGAEVDDPTLYASMAYFERRLIQTQVTIADGHTVVMGGLVDERTETFRDQVPFLGDIPYLGRLFRTEGSRSAKKNLTIFVKATQIDANGLTRAERELARQ